MTKLSTPSILPQLLVAAVAVLGLSSCEAINPNPSKDTPPNRKQQMELGTFSISLAVKDLAASRAFYEKLGFTKWGGEPAQNWLILQNGGTTIGLFQGMFEQNIMTFNPGWNSKGETLESFLDVREIQRRLKEQGLKMTSEADESTTGPASLVLIDPDGNQILIDQHVK